MAGANLHVKVGADVEGFLGQMRRLDDSFHSTTKSVNDHGFALNKAQRVLEGFAAEATGANHVLANLSTVIADFGAGSVLTTGILAGIGAIALAYDKLTEGARRAREENDKFVKSLVDQTAAERATTVAGSELVKLQADLALQQAKSASGVGLGSILLNLIPGVGAGSLTAGDQNALGKSVADAQTAVAQAAKNLAKAYDDSAGKERTALATLISSRTATPADQARAHAVLTGLQRQMAGTTDITARGDLQGQIDQLQNAFKTAAAPAVEAAKAAAQAALEASKTYWNQQHDLWMQATAKVQELQNIGRTYLRDNPASKVANDIVMAGIDTSYTMPNVAVNDGLTKDQIKAQERMGIHLMGNADKNADLLKNTIESTTANLASVLVSALNIGGGGRGSQIGGAFGGAIGFGVGTFAGAKLGGLIGSIVPGIGTVVGSLVGSAIGGLFGHHDKAVQQNTAAVERLTQQLVQNAPTGFKVESYRYNATSTDGRRLIPRSAGSDVVVYGDLHVHGVTDLKQLDRSVRKRSTRGGATILTPAAA